MRLLRCLTLPLAIAAAALLLHLVAGDRYGFFRDELYFIACGQRLAWGYVDQPPLAPLVARFAADLAGSSVLLFRLPAMLAHAGTVFLAGVVARRLGGGSFAVALACVATAVSGLLLAGGHLLTMNAFEPLVWLGCAAVVLAIMDGADRRWWLAAGALVGVGMLNKHSMIFFAACLAAGLMLTPERRVLRSRWLVLAAAFAAVLVLPHVLWQVHNGFPMLELLRNGQLHKNTELRLGDFLAGILVEAHPLTAPVWLAGLAWLVLRRRALGLACLLLVALYAVLGAKVYYVAPILPLAYAAGGVALERVLACWPRARLALPVIVAAGGLAVAPLAIPLLPEARLIAYQQWLGVEPPRLEKKEYRALAQHFADQHGWPRMVEAVARAWQTLAPEEQARAVIFGQNYGEAAAVDFVGPSLGLPGAVSAHNNYFLWGPGEHADVMVKIGGSLAGCRTLGYRSSAEVERTGRDPYVMPYEDDLPIFICRDPERPLRELWPELKSYE